MSLKSSLKSSDRSIGKAKIDAHLYYGKDVSFFFLNPVINKLPSLKCTPRTSIIPSKFRAMQSLQYKLADWASNVNLDEITLTSLCPISSVVKQEPSALLDSLELDHNISISWPVGGVVLPFASQGRS